MSRPSLSYANVMSTIAVFAALGGTSYAAVQLGKGDVKKRHIANNAVTSAKVKNGTLRARDFRAADRPARGAQGPQGPAGATGATGPAGPKGDPGPSEARAVHHMAGGPAIDSTGQTTIASLTNVAAGSYVIMGKANVFSTGPNKLAVCFLNAGSSQDRAEGFIGNAAGATIDLSLSTHLTHTFTAPGTITLDCGTDGGTAATNGIRLTAVRIGSETSAAF